MFSRRSLLVALGTLAGAILPAAAQTYPNRPIRMIVPFPPAGTPAAIVAALNRAINESLATTEAKAGLARFSAIAQTGSPQDFAALIASELPKWAAIVKLAGAKIEQ